MANRRNKVMNAPVNPAIMPGFIFIADSVTMDDAAVLTVSFPAKTVFTAIATTTGTSVASAHSVSSDTATVTFTATGNGTVDFIIIASVVETVAALDIGTEATYTLTPTT